MYTLYARLSSIDIIIKVQTLFEKHHTAAWFLEKYDPTEKYSDLRARVRKQGWHGALDHFLDDLEAGRFDHIVEAAKITTTPTVAATEKAEPQNGEAQTTVAVEETSEEKKELSKPEDEEEKVDDDAEWNANGDSDEVVIPHKGHQVMIKTIPPDIGRLRLEPVCLFKPWNWSQG